MLTRWQGWVAASVVTLIAVSLVVSDIDDRGMRHWWVRHALTTDTIAGLLVLLITVLVVDQLVRIRQLNDRSLAVGAQAAIMMAQANRAAAAVSAAVSGAARGTGDRQTALDEVRTYLVMLLVGAPVLIDDRISRGFLEQAQYLGGELAHALSVTGGSDAAAYPADRLDRALADLKATSAPLLRSLSANERIAAAGIDVG